MTASWTFGHYPRGKFLSLAFPAPPKGRLPSKAVIRSLIRDVQREGSWEKGGNGWDRRRQTPSRSQTRGAVVLSSRLGWDKLPNSWSSAPSLLLLPLSLKKGKKEREEGEKRKGWAGGRKEVNENQTHSPVWSGCEQWGGWCHKSGAGFSPYLFLHFAISPSTSVGPFFSHARYLDILLVFVLETKEKNVSEVAGHFFPPFCCYMKITLK